jgi:GNAT superfamily N-acetyltransferase
MTDFTYKKAEAEDILPALELARRVLTDESIYACVPGPTEAEKYTSGCRMNPDKAIGSYSSGERLMLLALDGGSIAGLISECGDGRISLLVVDGKYRRRGVATALMKRMVCELKLRGFDKIALNAPENTLPFFARFGFIQAADKHEKDGFFAIPMDYGPNEIWDVYDINRNKTGRYADAAGNWTRGIIIWSSMFGSITQGRMAD